MAAAFILCWVGGAVSRDRDWARYKGPPVIIDPPLSGLTHWLEAFSFVLFIVLAIFVIVDLLDWFRFKRQH